ncbi:MAG: SLC13 family permease [Desulfonatronovibrionaceae bacterium]
MEANALTGEMILVLFMIGLAILLFVMEWIRVDMVAILMTISLPLLGLVTPKEAFSGFSSNAVISIIAVIIIGAGLDKTGLINRVVDPIVKLAGNSSSRVIIFMGSTVAIISSFMQNIGAAALFMSVIRRISLRTGIPSSQLLMPMGFSAILGGTLTLIGSSPLILLNDLIRTANESLDIEPIPTFGMFDVTPIGLALIVCGVLYFMLLGPLVLPKGRRTDKSGNSTIEYFHELYGIDGEIYEVAVNKNSRLAGRTVAELERLLDNRAVAVGLYQQRDMRISPAADIVIQPGSVLALLGNKENIQRVCREGDLQCLGMLKNFSEALSRATAGISEVVIPPRSNLAGKTLKDIRMRKSFGTSVLAVNRSGRVIRDSLRDLPLRAGDVLVLHSLWEDLVDLEKNPDFVVISRDFPHDVILHEKLPHAVVISAITFGLVIFTDLRLSIPLMSGAIAMVMAGVLSMDEAYKAVSWQSVFLLAALIPLGLAMETTGTAQWIALQTVHLLGNVHFLVLQAAVAVLATAFTLLMSNVGATVLLVPLAINIALLSGADPAMFAMTVAISTSNSFLIPTHQVNALIMEPGKYRNADFMKAGAGMTVIFLAVSLLMLNLLF